MANIIVCSDGTGNAGRQMEGTNVWRIRQAVQAHEASVREQSDQRDGCRPEQIVVYQDGVGTESFRPLAILGLAFSSGVTRDLQTLYERLMLTYREGDSIYLFGFSRGAFTIRTLAYMLYRCGLASPHDENGVKRTPAEIRCIARDAVDAYKMRHIGRDTQFRQTYGIELNSACNPAWFDTNEYDSLAACAADGKGRVPIHFVGVWDTVSAVGLPFHNVTQFLFLFWRRVSALWPLRLRIFRLFRFSLLNFRRPTNRYWKDWEDDLHPYIKHAYQALSLDDERETFYPMLWLQLQECDCGEGECGKCVQVKGSRYRWGGILKKLKSFPARRKPNVHVEQVWFAGMHSDVGGGYDKDHLAHVSLQWMMCHAAAAGLKFDEGVWAQYRQLADPLGQMHDSRAGLGLYYRYNPRDVQWFSQDAGLSAEWGEPPLIHRTVFQRIQFSAQAYAPKGVPFGKEYDEVENPPSHVSQTSESQRNPWQSSATVANASRSMEQAWTLNQDKEAGRREAKKIIDLYVVLRRATSRWVVYITVFILGIGTAEVVVRKMADLEARIFSSFQQFYDSLPRPMENVSPLCWIPIFAILLLLVAGVLPGLLPLKRAPIKKKRIPRWNTYSAKRGFAGWMAKAWPTTKFFLQLGCVIAIGFVLRPLLRTAVMTVAPMSISTLLEGMLGSPLLFGLLSGLIFSVLWANSHVADRIEQWAAYGWNYLLYENARKPDAFIVLSRSWVEFIFGERGGLGRYAGPFFARFAYPVFAIVLLACVLLFFAWIPVADGLIRMRVVQKNGADEAWFVFDAKQVTATSVRLQRGRPYRLLMRSNGKLWQDANIQADLNGIPWNEEDAAQLGRTAPGINNNKIPWLSTPSMRIMSFLTRNPDERYFQLCGSIGSPSATAFPITPGIPFIANEEGELFLFVNDVPGFYFNNSGCAELRLHVIH